MVNFCFLYNKKASRTDNISLHRFPKNFEIRIKWLKTCGLTVENDVRRTCICSRHFKAEDICLSNIFGAVKSSIKRDAVPTLYLTNPLNIDSSNKLEPNTPLSELFNKNEVTNQSSSFFSNNNIVDGNNILSIVEKSPENYIELDSFDDQTSNKSNINSDDSDKQFDSNEFMKNATNFGNDDKNTDENNSTSEHRKRKFFEPRHVSEISLSDFATPKRAKRTISLIKTDDKKKKKK